MNGEQGFDQSLYKRFPTARARPKSEVETLKKIWCAPRGWEYITAVSNNYIGIYYFGTALLFFLLAGILALVMRVQLAAPAQTFLSPETYNQFFTMHGTVMMFLFAVPAVEAVGVLLLPQMLGARDLPFPRLSAYAFWTYFIGGLAFFASLFVGWAPDGGWFMYPPLTGRIYSPGINTDFWLLGIGFIEISAIAGAIEFIVGVLRTRAPGMSLDKMPILAWAFLVFSIMIILGFPSVIFCTLLLELERALNWPFFDATRGGDPLLWQHLFWFFGHPEVYIIFLPAAAMLSMVVTVVARSDLIGYHLVVLAMIATGLLSFGVWAHHMLTTGLSEVAVGAFSAASTAVAVPAGLQVFAWIATLAAGRPVLNAPGLFTIGSIVIFVTGGLTGVMVALAPFDWQAHDSYFVVAHLHYVLLGGMLFPLFAAIYYWLPSVSRKPLSDHLGKWVFWLMFAGTNITFMPMHFAGLMGMPRRVYTYLPSQGLDVPNMISTGGAFVIAAGLALFLSDLARNFRPAPGEGNAGNVYGGGTLEWLPSGLYSTRSIPLVTSRQPLWEQPNLARDVEQGKYFLPRSVTGLRETILTSAVSAQPEQLLIIPGPSAWPVTAAVFTSGFFLLLTVQAYIAGMISGVLAIAAVLRWLWESDRPVAIASADIGAGIMVPTFQPGYRNHGVWAMIIVLVVLAMIFLMAIFSLFYLWSNQPDFWRIAAPWNGMAVMLGAAALGLALSLASVQLLRRLRAPLSAATAIFAALLCLIFAALADYYSWQSAGLDPAASGQGAIIHGILAHQASVIFASGVMALYVAGRAIEGSLSATKGVTLDAVSLFFSYTACQQLIISIVTRVLPVP